MHHKPMIDHKKKDNFGTRTSSLVDIDRNFKPLSNTERDSSKKLIINNFKLRFQNESN